ncbi:hypothetical protein GE09DRAFT_1049784 [Coniochaeta sp. 2T2.1]|nr:hypothetical protein GE09DRAFT_1049784 [Coniochaeta sp. 2T2.1]
MDQLALLLAVFPAALAIPLLQATPRTQAANVVLQVNKATSEASINIYDQARSRVLGYGCSLSLISGPFQGIYIVFNVNELSAGGLGIGQQKYTDYDNTELSGGVKCGCVTS